MNLDRRLLAEASRVRLRLALAVGAGLLAGVATVWQALLLSNVVARGFLGGDGLASLWSPLLLLLGVIAARSALVWLRETAAQAAAARVQTSLRERYLRQLVELGPVHVAGARTGALATTAVEGVEALEAYYAQFLPNLALAALVPLAILACVAPVDPLSAFVLALTAPLIPVFTWLVGKMADGLARRQWQSLSRLSAHFLDVIQGLPTLKLYGRSREQGATIAAVGERFRLATMAVLRVAFLSALSQELLATISTAIVAVEVGLRLLYGHLGFEQAVFVLILAPEFYQPLRNLGASFHASAPGVAASRELFAVLESPVPSQGQRPVAQGLVPHDAEPSARPGLKPVLSGSEGPRAEDTKPPAGGWDRSQPASVGFVSSARPVMAGLPTAADKPPRRGPVDGTAASVPLSRHGKGDRGLGSPFPLVFSNVHYAYGGGRPALRGVSFAVREGETVALVGPSGAGKSTIAQLLLRFLEPDAGLIACGGRPLAEVPPQEWRRLLAWVPQSPYLFNGSIADNIRLARPEATEQEVIRAATQAGCADFLAALPRGLDTSIGERGARLSGGQAQRVALARAFLRDAPFVVLDEPLANLDPAQAALIQESIERLLAGRTALMIAHRLSTVRRADRIVVLSEGRVAQSGAHHELLSAGGLYQRLVAAAAGGSS